PPHRRRHARRARQAHGPRRGPRRSSPAAVAADARGGRRARSRTRGSRDRGGQVDQRPDRDPAHLHQTLEAPPVRTHRNLLLAFVFSFALVGAACSSSSTTETGSNATTGGGAGTTAPPKATGAITVSAAASLQTPFTTIGNDFKKANPGVTDVKFNFDSSGTLSKQIHSG